MKTTDIKHVGQDLSLLHFIRNHTSLLVIQCIMEHLLQPLIILPPQWKCHKVIFEIHIHNAPPKHNDKKQLSKSIHFKLRIFLMTRSHQWTLKPIAYCSNTLSLYLVEVTVNKFLTFQYQAMEYTRLLFVISFGTLEPQYKYPRIICKVCVPETLQI